MDSVHILVTSILPSLSLWAFFRHRKRPQWYEANSSMLRTIFSPIANLAVADNLPPREFCRATLLREFVLYFVVYMPFVAITAFLQSTNRKSRIAESQSCALVVSLRRPIQYRSYFSGTLALIRDCKCMYEIRNDVNQNHSVKLANLIDLKFTILHKHRV